MAEVQANVKQVSVKILMSGDKEVRIVLSIVGDEVNEALNIGKLSPDQTVIIKTP